MTKNTNKIKKGLILGIGAAAGGTLGYIYKDVSGVVPGTTLGYQAAKRFNKRIF